MKDQTKGILLFLGVSATIPHLSPTHLFPFPPVTSLLTGLSSASLARSNACQLLCGGA